MPERHHSVPLEFRISEELYDEVCEVTQDHHLTHKEFAVASIGLLNEAHAHEFSRQRTTLRGAGGKPISLPSIKTPDSETVWPRIIRASLAPSLYDPVAEYADEDLSRIRDRGRQAFRFGVFVLSHVSPLPGDSVMFLHDGDWCGIPFQTQRLS